MKIKRVKKDRLLPYILPSLCGILFFYGIPFILSFYYALLNNMGEKKLIGLKNFSNTLQNPMFQRGLKNQSLFIAIAVPLCFILALFFALQIMKLKKGKKLIFLISIIPFVIPSGTSIYFWKCIFDVNGLANKILYSLNIPMVNWYNSKWVMAIAVIIFIWKNVGATSLILYVGLNQIPKEYYEISDIEGINRFQKFYKITLVYLTPIIFISIILLVVNSFKIFKEIYLLFGNYPGENIYLLQHYMNNHFFRLNLQKLTTAAYLLFVIIGVFICLMFLLQKRYSDTFNTLNFDGSYKNTYSKRNSYFASSFSIIMGLLFLLPIIFIISNSFMGELEIISRYTKDITQYNVTDLTANGMHFVNIGFISDNPTISSYLNVLFNNPKYLKAYLNSILIIVPILVGQSIISPLAAYAFEYSKWRYKEILFFIYILIMLMPLQVLLVPNYLVVDWLGLVDTHWAIILPAIFNPIGVFIIRLQLKGFPKECIEAAQNNGATHFQIFKYIVLPNMKSSIAILVVLIFTEYWNVIEQGIVFLKTSSLEPLSIYLSQIVDENLGVFFSTSCLYLIPVFIIFFIGSKLLSSNDNKSVL
ncbi:ABC transporter permease subunit [Proteiniborus sp. MB09-C3]|uniref:ABC transporter permease n=1 Tax=Proteiniborus sp. MB09-C3 TaxID=3050072 RepID=UPI00255563EB|nr:ABC transporter permease subunit [Proteiniborus sp. MB09-C3]WIV13716.1 ABC transporter permease subunit [Proteiniborus sp. MB09-C3]